MNDNALMNKASGNIRVLSASMVEKAKSGHPGGSLSISDLLTYLYFVKLNIDPKNPKMKHS